MTIRGILTFAGLLLAVNLTLAASCQRHMDPIGVGGAVATGGSPATGGATPVVVIGGNAATGGSGPLSLCQQACANLAKFGCPEDQATCPAQCELNSKDARFTQNIQCRINATSKAAIQACGIASCK